MVERLGLTHIYTGDGKGKTTAAVGLAVRAAGRGLRVRVIQFMKGSTSSGEFEPLRRMSDIDIDRIGGNFLSASPPDRTEVAVGLEPAMAAAAEALTGQYHMVILDELVTAVAIGVVSEDAVLALIDNPGRRAELVLTGRGASERLMAAADLVTEMRAIKHPFDQGVPARKGIEF